MRLELEEFIERYLEKIEEYIMRWYTYHRKPTFFEALYYVAYNLERGIIYYMNTSQIYDSMINDIIKNPSSLAQYLARFKALSNMIRNVEHSLALEYFSVGDYKKINPAKVADVVRKRIDYWLEYIHPEDLDRIWFYLE